MNFWNRKKEKEPWQICASRFCLENSEKGFTYEELRNFIKSNYKVGDKHVMFFFQEEIQAPSGRQYSRQPDLERWVPPLDLVSKVTDYDELKEARENAKNAFWISMGSVLIALVTLVVTIYTK